MHVNAMHMRPSTDPHEPYFHLAEVMTAHVILEKGMVSIHASATHFHFYLHPCSPLRLDKPLNLMEMHQEDKAVLLRILHNRGFPPANTQAYLVYKGTSWNSLPISRPAMTASMSALSLEAFAVPMPAKSGKMSITGRKRFIYLRHSDALEALMDGGYVYTPIDESHFFISA